MIKGTRIFKITVSGGKVDPKPFNKYKDWKDAIENNSFAGESAYQEKAKANYRWMLMSMALQKGLDTLSNIKAEATSSSIPGSVEFILTYTQPDALWYKDENDEVVYEDKIDVITKLIEDVLKQEYKVILTYFSPDAVTSNNDKIYSSPLAKGTVMEELVVEASTPSVSAEELVDGYREFDVEENLDADEE